MVKGGGAHHPVLKRGGSSLSLWLNRLKHRGVVERERQKEVEECGLLGGGGGGNIDFLSFNSFLPSALLLRRMSCLFRGLQPLLIYLVPV